MPRSGGTPKRGEEARGRLLKIGEVSKLSGIGVEECWRSMLHAVGNCEEEPSSMAIPTIRRHGIFVRTASLDGHRPDGRGAGFRLLRYGGIVWIQARAG